MRPGTLRTSLRSFLASLALCAPSSAQQHAAPLFDGTSLAGWTTSGGRYDGPALWSVEDGAITGRQGPNKEGGLIYTERFWHSFDLELDAFIDHPFDSGIFLRMVPPSWEKAEGPQRARGGKGLQVTLDHRPGGEIAGIYADGWLQNCPEGEKHYKQGEWNHVRVRLYGTTPRVEVWINGTKTTDYSLPVEAVGYAPSGRIGLQVHGGENVPATQTARFKNIVLRELPVFDRALFELDEQGALVPHPGAKAAGWTALLDEQLSHWEESSKDEGYAFRDGGLALLTEGPSPHLATKKDYRDFVLRFEFQIARMANSGLFLRAARDGSNPAFSGCEIQILDDFNWEKTTNSKLAPYQFTGGLYGSLAPGIKDAHYPLGRWNTYEITYRGSRIACRLNGELLYDVDTHELKGEPPFAKRAATGFIGLQRHAPGGIEGDAFAWFRNMYVRELPQDR
jgi:hypothetical protein